MKDSYVRRKYRGIGIRGKYILLSESIIVIVLLFSYIIFIQDKIMYSESSIKESLKDAAVLISMDTMVRDSLAEGKGSQAVESYGNILSEQLENVDIIVICDMTGKKYAHPDHEQVGDYFIGTDRKDVLKYGTSYYTLKEGSMGTTLRFFYPIQKDGKQVGFVMVGRYKEEIGLMNRNILVQYIGLFVCMFAITFVVVGLFATYFKKTILNMEPEEIATLYLQKDTILSHVQDGIILLNEGLEIEDVNDNSYYFRSDSAR